MKESRKKLLTICRTLLRSKILVTNHLNCSMLTKTLWNLKSRTSTFPMMLQILRGDPHEEATPDAIGKAERLAAELKRTRANEPNGEDRVDAVIETNPNRTGSQGPNDLVQQDPGGETPKKFPNQRTLNSMPIS
jgi:hypothetical protein